MGFNIKAGGPNWWEYALLALVVPASFLVYSSNCYPLLNSDDALNILMTFYYKLPNDWYCWGQDRGGTLLPLLSQIFYRGLGCRPVTAVSLSNYLILLLGYLGFSSLIKNRGLRMVLALVWFFPPFRFVDLLRFPLGVQYSLLGLGIALLRKIDFRYGHRIRNHVYSLLVLVIAVAALWVSDFAWVSFSVLTAMLIVSHRLRQQGNGLSPMVVLYVVLGIVGAFLFIRYAKQYAQVQNDNYTHFNSWEGILGSFRMLLGRWGEVFAFHAADALFSMYAWGCGLAVLVLFHSFWKSADRANWDRWQWAYFFAADLLAVFGGIMLSKWVALNNLGRWYFIPNYISLWMLVLVLADNLSLRRVWKRITVIYLLVLALLGGYSSIRYMQRVYPGTLRSQVDLRSELLQLGRIGLVADFWNAYISASPDPERIKATPHDGGVKTMELVDAVFEQPRLYVIRDMWMDHFPDTLLQFGRVMVKEGYPFRMGGCFLNQYVCVPRYEQIGMASFFFNKAVRKDDSSAVVEAHIPEGCMMWGPYFNLCKGKYVVQFRIHVDAFDRNRDIARCDVVTDYGNRQFAQQHVSPENLNERGDVRVILHFTLNEYVQGMEFRVFTAGGVAFSVGEVVLQEL